MKTILSSFILILISTCFVTAQDTTWTDSKQQECTRELAKYYQLETKKGDLTSFTGYFVSNDQVWNTGQYLAGKKQGKFLFYYENGQKATEFTCIKGKIEGEYTNWHANGAVREHGFYKEGLQTGRWTEHNEDGDLLNEENMDDGWGVEETDEFGETDEIVKIEAIEEPADIKPGPNDFIMLEEEPIALNMDSVRKLIGYPEGNLVGTVILRVQVSEEGRIEKHLVIKEAHPILTERVVGKIEHLRFSPGSLPGGKVVKVWVTVPFDFKRGY